MGACGDDSRPERPDRDSMKPILDAARTQRWSAPASAGEAWEPRGGRAVNDLPASPQARLVAGRYRLRGVLGRGGMGIVWLAEDGLLHRLVALKQDIVSDRASDGTHSAGSRRLLNEARAAAKVNHREAVTIYDVVNDDGESWIVMEPLFGRTLAEVVADEGPLSIARVTDIALRLLSVLETAHRVGIVHSDVKPPNVHLCDDGRVVLTDFGVACNMLDEAGDSTQVFAASPVYTAPERLRYAKPEPASDLFSLGATLFAAVEGKSPFSGASLFDTVIAVVKGEPAPFRHADSLRPVIEGLLAKNPADRLTAEQTRMALLGIQHEAQLRPDWESNTQKNDVAQQEMSRLLSAA
jgi:serine/threonine protein kinase